MNLLTDGLTPRSLLEAPRGVDAASEQAWFESLLRWLLDRDRLARISAPNRSWRLQVLSTAIDQHPQRDALLERLSSVWKHSSAVRLLAEMGLPDQTSFMKEATQRITDRLVPRLDPHEDLYALLERLNLSADDADWLESLPEEVHRRWGAIFEPSAQSLRTAVELLAVRAAALGLSRELLLRLPGSSELESPFLTLPQAARELAHHPGDAAGRDAWTASRAACELAITATQARLDEHGVSVELVFRLDLVRATLARAEALMKLAVGHGGDGFALAIELVRGSASQHSLGELLRMTMRGLALKVVEHTAHTGEHYIANTPAEWWAMLRSASGGGALTSVTAFIKYGLAALPLAPGLMGGAMALNYSLSFIALQFLGFSLASKQPSMTGSALADALDQKNGLGAEIDLVASIARTQLVAAVGNVFVAVPAALVLDLAWRAVTGHPLLDATQGEHGLADLHPFRSLTLPFAAITGVFLFLSSLAAGLSANWSAFRSLSRAVSRSPRARALFGTRGAHWLAVQVGRHFSGIVAYVVLGFLLGFVPVLFKFAGVGLEVRHVTLSSAAMALDASALFSAGDLQPGPLIWACVGIVLIGALNFGVSFALALRVALQARGLVAVDRRRLVRGLLGALVRTPGRFLLPPRMKPAATD